MGFLESLVKPRQKAETGIGASMIRHGIPLSGVRDTPQKRAETALAAYKRNTYIRSAERAIVNRITNVPWWLEDPEGERVTDESPEELRGVRDLLEMPYRPSPGDPIVATPKTFDALRALTIRHMGLTGYGFWYLVGVETLGLPLEVLYINPTRMLPATDDDGALTGWVLDPDARGKGTPLSVDEVVPFYLEPPEDGFLPEGLVSTALTKVELQRMGDQFAGQLLATGGRIPGMLAPQEGSIPDETYQALVRDLRSIMEDPNAAKRTLVLKGPVSFTETAMPPGDMQTLDLMTMSGDDILSLWGVPRSQIGYQRPAGIGESIEDKDAEMMWKNAAGPRAFSFYDTVQHILDRFEFPVTINLDLPEFDAEAPKYDMAQKASVVPLRTVERRAILGLPPLGDPMLDNQIVLPINVVPTDMAPEFDPGDAVKARLEGNRQVVRLRDALTGFLKDQAERIGRRLEDKAGHVQNKPNDDSVWWNQKREDEALQKILAPFVTDFAQAGAQRAASKVHGKAVGDDVFTDSLLAQTMKRLALRVTQINKTTRDRIRNLIGAGLDAELSPSEMGVALRGTVKPLEGDTTGNELRRRLGDFGSELRAETIARTEMRVAQNAGTIDAYAQDGVQQVEMIDGDGDPECAARDGRVVSLEEAERHMAEEHPNGTLDFAPIVNLEPQKATIPEQEPSRQPATVAPPAIITPPSAPPTLGEDMQIHIHNHAPGQDDPGSVEVEEVLTAKEQLEALKAMLEAQPAPVINVQPPDVHIDPATVNVAAPEVTVQPPEVKVDVQAPQKASGDIQPVYVTNMPKGKKVKRDPSGRIDRIDNV